MIHVACDESRDKKIYIYIRNLLPSFSLLRMGVLTNGRQINKADT